MAANMCALSSGVIASAHPLQIVTESKLIADAKRGHRPSLEALCEAAAPKIIRVLYRITRNREDAEDALQDCFLRALIHLKEFDGRSAFSTWLTRIAINSALMNRRKNRKAREVSMDDLNDEGQAWLREQLADNAPSPEQVCAERQQKKLLDDAIRTLRPRIRAAVEFRQLQELSMRETAKTLGISVAATKGRLFHARAALRKTNGVRTIAKSRTVARPTVPETRFAA